MWQWWWEILGDLVVLGFKMLSFDSAVGWIDFWLTILLEDWLLTEGLKTDFIILWFLIFILLDVLEYWLNCLSFYYGVEDAICFILFEVISASVLLLHLRMAARLAALGFISAFDPGYSSLAADRRLEIVLIIPFGFKRLILIYLIIDPCILSMITLIGFCLGLNPILPIQINNIPYPQINQELHPIFNTQLQTTIFRILPIFL